MISVKHPLESCNKEQAIAIKNTPDEKKRFLELLFSHGNAAYIYHNQAKDFSPTEEYFQEWLEGLPENLRSHMIEKGFESCKTVLSFTRYINEKNDIGMDAFIEKLMGSEYREYLSLLGDKAV